MFTDYVINRRCDFDFKQVHGQGRGREGGGLMRLEGKEMIKDLLIQSLQRPPAPLPPPPAWIEEERFLLSLAPSLHRLPPQQREFVKIENHKLIYENTFVTLNLDVLE